MQKILIVSAILWTCITGEGPLSAQVWTKKSNFSGKGDRTQAFSTDTKGYLFSTSNTLWEYEPTMDIWTQKATLPGGLKSQVTAFAVGQKAYICYGYISGTMSTEVWEFDMASNSWVQKNNFPGPARIGASGFSYNGRGYAGLGYNGSAYLRDFWEYDIAADTWTKKPDMPGVARAWAAHFCIGGNAYVCLGIGSSSTQGLLQYNFMAGTWTTKATFPYSRWNSAGFSIDNLGYIYAGEGPPYYYYNDLWIYDPSFNTWSQGQGFSGAGRASPFAFSINSCAYVGGGIQANIDSTIYLHDAWALCFPTAAEEPENSVRVTAYPNPFSEQTTLRIDFPVNGATLRIDNCSGQTVMHLNNINGRVISLSRGDLANGLYYARLIEGGKLVSVYKLLITDP